RDRPDRGRLGHGPHPAGEGGLGLRGGALRQAGAAGRGLRLPEAGSGRRVDLAHPASQGAKGLYAQDYAKAKGYDYTVVDWVEGHQPSSPQIEAFLEDTGETAGGRR